MKFINTPEDVELRPYMKGEEKFNYSVCPTCQRLEKKPVGGNPRCQGVKKAKRLKTTEGDILLAEHWVQCESRASTEIDGKWYCGMHAKKIGDQK
jgi:hypothetical protein